MNPGTTDNISPMPAVAAHESAGGNENAGAGAGPEPAVPTADAVVTAAAVEGKETAPAAAADAEASLPANASLASRLTPEQKEKIAVWLVHDRQTYEATRTRVAEEFGVTTSTESLRRFYSSYVSPWRYAQAAGAAETFGQLMQGKFDEPSIAQAKQLAFTALTAPEPDAKAALAWLKIVNDAEKLKIARERLALEARRVEVLEEKAALADEARGIAEKAELSEEEQGARLRALFSMG